MDSPVYFAALKLETKTKRTKNPWIHCFFCHEYQNCKTLLNKSLKIFSDISENLMQNMWIFTSWKWTPLDTWHPVCSSCSLPVVTLLKLNWKLISGMKTYTFIPIQWGALLNRCQLRMLRINFYRATLLFLFLCSFSRTTVEIIRNKMKHA